MKLIGDAKAVLFDAGHTLLDPVRPVEDVYYETAVAMGVSLPRDDFYDQMRSMFGRLRQDFRSKDPELVTSEEIERKAWHDFTQAIAEPFKPLASRHVEWLGRLVEYFDHPRAWKPVEGARDVLAGVRARDIRVAIVSNWYSVLSGILDELRLTDQVDLITISSVIGRNKPHSQIFHDTLSKLNVRPEESVHVGDSWEEDVLGAKGAGLGAIYFSRSGNCPEARPTVPVIRSLAELLS